MQAATRRVLVAGAMGVVLAVGAFAPAATSLAAARSHGDRAYYILPPGNYGGFPTTANSTDQLPLYDALTPLRGNVTDASIAADYLPENFKPVGATHVENTGHAGTTVVYDAYGIPHITGKTRADLAFGAGWVTARDRLPVDRARARPGACRGCRHSRHQRVRFGDERSVVRARARRSSRS